MYELVSEKFMLKDQSTELFFDTDYTERDTYRWRKELILYKALYINPDGQYFSRLPEDFYANFEKVEKWKYTQVILQKLKNWSRKVYCR